MPHAHPQVWVYRHSVRSANATTTVANETSHLVTALQAALLWALGRNETSDRGTPTTHIS